MIPQKITLLLHIKLPDKLDVLNKIGKQRWMVLLRFNSDACVRK